MRRFLSILIALTLLLSLLSGCASKNDDFGVADQMDQISDQDSEKDDSQKEDSPESDNKQENNKKPSKEEENSSPKEEQKNPSANQKDEQNQNPSEENKNNNPQSENPPTIEKLTNLQKAGVDFNAKAGQTVWFGPVAITEKNPLTVGGKPIAASALKEVSKLGGGYRLYSYKLSADASVQIPASKGYESRFLISLNQEMTEAEYYNHIDQKGIQLYDSALDSTGKTIHWDGKESSSTAYHLTHGVSLQKGDTLTFGPCSPAQVVQAFGYNAKGKATALLNASNLKAEGFLESGYGIYTYTTQEEIQSVKILVPAALKGKVLMMKNKTFSTTEYASISGVSPSSLPSLLKDKTALFVGDSVCEGWKNSNTGVARFPDAYAGLIAKQTGVIATNAGVGSSTISNEKPVYNQFESHKGKDFDYVVIQGGINDMSHKRKIGQISDSFDPEDWDLSTYAGGLEYTIMKAIEYFGDTAAIGCLFSYQSPNHPSGNGAKLPDYVKVGKEICEKWGIPYLDMCNHQEITQKLQFSEKINTSDFIHLNTNGYNIVTPYIIDFMKAMIPCSQTILEKGL